MSKTTTLFIGLDVLKDSISVVRAKEQRGSAVVFVGQIGPRRSDIDELLPWLQSKALRSVFNYEAGRCGYAPLPPLRQQAARVHGRRALVALRGVQEFVAITTVAEIGDLTRIDWE